MVYRVQNHAMDLSLPGGEDALLFSVDERHAASCIHVPRQISRDELVKLLADMWITDYEKLHKVANQPIQSTESHITSNPDGSVAIKFSHNHVEKPCAIFHSLQFICSQYRFLLHSLVTKMICHIPKICTKPSPPDGKPIFWQNNPNIGHKFWDPECACAACLFPDRDSLVQALAKTKRKKNKKSDPLFSAYLAGDPSVAPLGEPSGKYDYLVKYSTPDWRRNEPYLEVPPPEDRHIDDTPWDIDPAPVFSTPTAPSSSVLMYYHKDEDFPPLTPFVKWSSRHAPKVQNAQPEILLSGQTRPVSAAEEVLNWQTENALAQNQALSRIDQGVTHVSTTLTQVATQMDAQSSQVKDLIQALQHRLDTLKYDTPGIDWRLHAQHQQSETKFLQNTIANLHGYSS